MDLGALWQGRSQESGWERPQTSAMSAIFGFLGLKGPCFLACSTSVSSPKMASHWSHPMAITNMPKSTLSITRMTECRMRACTIEDNAIRYGLEYLESFCNC